MQIGTEILIERMNTHPEEFQNGVLSKWARMMELTECLPDEDKAAIKNAFNKAKMDYFNGEVLATLAGERELLGTTAGTNTGRARNAAQQSPYGNALGSNSALGSGGNGIWSNLF